MHTTLWTPCGTLNVIVALSCQWSWHATSTLDLIAFLKDSSTRTTGTLRDPNYSEGHSVYGNNHAMRRINNEVLAVG